MIWSSLIDTTNSEKAIQDILQWIKKKQNIIDNMIYMTNLIIMN